ncbi:MAG: DUF456 domain-containing protein [Elusimicrobiota bacterium]|nr:DUF456 domain-containing protein [Elusimicrobiota bacterium]
MRGPLLMTPRIISRTLALTLALWASASASHAGLIAISWDTALLPSRWRHVTCDDNPSRGADYCAPCNGVQGYVYSYHLQQVGDTPLYNITPATPPERDGLKQFLAAPSGTVYNQGQLNCGGQRRWAREDQRRILGDGHRIVVRQAASPGARTRSDDAGAPLTSAIGRTLDYALFGLDSTAADEPRENLWLTFAEYAEFRRACAHPAGTPTDTAECRSAVTAARVKVGNNLRAEPFPGHAPKTYQQAYRELFPLPGFTPRAQAVLREQRVGTLHSILNSLKDKKYGQGDGRQDEVALNAGERARLGAAPASAALGDKTGAVVLQEYDAALNALDANDHVARYLLTKRYRLLVPAGAATPDDGTATRGPTDIRPPIGELQRLTPEEIALLPQELRDRYNAAMAGNDAAAQRAVLQEARDWLRDNRPTAAQFLAMTPADKRRACERWRADQPTTGGAAAPVAGALPQAQAVNAGANIDGEATPAPVAAAPQPAPAGATPRSISGYNWPPEFARDCPGILASGEPTQPPITSAPPPAPPQGNVAAQPLEPGGSTPPALTSWNPLLNGAKGAVLGGIVGFVLGGPLGMLVGALVFGGAAWGMTKVGDA